MPGQLCDELGLPRGAHYGDAAYELLRERAREKIASALVMLNAVLEDPSEEGWPIAEVQVNHGLKVKLTDLDAAAVIRATQRAMADQLMEFDPDA